MFFLLFWNSILVILDTVDIHCICEVPIFPVSALWDSTSCCICELSVHFLCIPVVLQEAGSQLSGSSACTQSRGTGLCKLPVSPSSTTAVPTVMMLGEHIDDYRSSLRENNWSLLKTTAFRLWRQVFVQILGKKLFPSDNFLLPTTKKKTATQMRRQTVLWNCNSSASFVLQPLICQQQRWKQETLPLKESHLWFPAFTQHRQSN